MTDNDLLFGIDDLERWKRGDHSEVWLEQQKAQLLARSQAQSAGLKQLLASANPALVSRLNKPL
ncbi:MAG: hypothetical protein P0Y50_06020 [Candidatus Brevundimonas colombiensis]|uniref:Uncharacterized protein n=1 Tax=Candidatus Brevundimonas colombiensis TaxID=3121376 RepID=A0AAJ5X6A5_9CAUL|nr:hypothetical protein [Brevundimonas sp.]WEK41160.1 MAG: hypothetical protein P0Y50_06020 [Brevundimonas sp.]